MKNISLEKVEYLYKDLVYRASESTTFKKELISNPEATIEKVVGTDMSIPKGFKIVVEDQTDPNIIYINIPKKIEVNELELELTDEQLETISGGDLGTTAVVITIIVGVAQIAEWLGDGWNNY